MSDDGKPLPPQAAPDANADAADRADHGEGEKSAPASTDGDAPASSSSSAAPAPDALLSPSLSASGRTSFVYPVRSLLAKDIQSAQSPPAVDDARAPPFSQRPASLTRRDTTFSTTSTAAADGDDQSRPSSARGRPAPFHQEDYGNLPSLIRSTAARTQPTSAAVSSDQQQQQQPPSEDGGNDRASASGSVSSSPTRPRRQMQEVSLDQTLAPTAFATSNSAAVSLSQLVHDATSHQAMSLQPPSAGTLAARREQYRSPPGGDTDGRDYFRQSPPSDVSDADADGERPSLSMAGLVHLGPRNNSTGGASVQSRGRSRSRHSMSPSDTPSDSSRGPLSSPGSPPTRPASAVADEQLIVTQRFQYVTDEDGHHVVSGREGTLTRCEDEPIRTPGAVQGYGVLIAIEEEMETGNFVVRQVSENSTKILGLSPRYLFSLECFTECLPDADQDVFFDNIQFLNVPESADEPESGEDSTHVFILSGWGAPGTASRADLDAGPDERKLWRCWCAAHRPRSVTSSTGDGPALSSDVSNVIILEFELERDATNPLYPAPSAGSFGSGTQSPASATGSQSTAGGSMPSMSTLSGRTLVSSAGGRGSAQTDATAVTRGPASALSGPADSDELSDASAQGLEGEEDWQPTPEHIFESTTNRAKPLPALERLRQMNRGLHDSRASTPASRGSASTSRRRLNRRPAPPPGVGMMDIFAVMSQINEQLGAAADLDSFLKIVVGVIKDLTQFHRVLVYQFDDQWNGQVVAELVDWHRTHDLYMGLHFPASDIPAQARELYAINKVRLLYDRDLPTARIVVRAKEDLAPPLNMTHCYLRAMSPIHIKYLGNMGVRASMSISIMAFGALWGLIACHSYGKTGMRVSFPVRQMLRLLSQSISRNIERLSYAHRLHTRKLINTVTSESHPGGYIVSNADDLLGLFDADYGMLVIGEGAKILGPNLHGQEILVVAEYLRLKQFNTMQVSQAVTTDFPDLKLSTGLEVIAGLLYVPLSSGGKDFIAFLRKGQPREVHWAGKPLKQGAEHKPSLEPRVSFKAWSQTVAGRSRAWTDEQLETAGVLALVYGKFIEVWRQKETALQSTKLTNLLLSNASHEVRTPLNHIINYLELALNGPLDLDTRDNLQRSHNASKSLLFTINDLLDLTRLESGNELAFNEPFNLKRAIQDAARLYINEASRRKLQFNLELSECPERVIGDSKKIQTVVANLTGNALKYTDEGSITVEARAFDEPHGLRDADGIAVEIIVADTGCGISSAKLESIFREFEQVESMGQAPDNNEGVGLGLAVVAHIVEQLGGQLRVDSKVGEGSRFSFLIPFATSQHSVSPPMSALGGRGSRGSSARNSGRSGGAASAGAVSAGAHSAGGRSVGGRSVGTHSATSAHSEVDSFVSALAASHMGPRIGGASPDVITGPGRTPGIVDAGRPGYFEVTGSGTPVRGVRIDETDLDHAVSRGHGRMSGERSRVSTEMGPSSPSLPNAAAAARREKMQAKTKLRVLIVEDDDVNRMLLGKRLLLQGHEVVNTTNGQECVNKIEEDRDFDCILMDVQMPILNGFQATERVREIETKAAAEGQPESHRLAVQLNGRIPIFAISATLKEELRERMVGYGLDGWVLKPVDFKRLNRLLEGITETETRVKDIWAAGHDWERGGWLTEPVQQQRDFAAQ